MRQLWTPHSDKRRRLPELRVGSTGAACAGVSKLRKRRAAGGVDVSAVRMAGGSAGGLAAGCAQSIASAPAAPSGVIVVGSSGSAHRRHCRRDNRVVGRLGTGQLPQCAMAGRPPYDRSLLRHTWEARFFFLNWRPAVGPSACAGRDCGVLLQRRALRSVASASSKR